MNCHICAGPAIGECQVCWKFYCAEHGERSCQTCQQPVTTPEELAVQLED